MIYILPLSGFNVKYDSNRKQSTTIAQYFLAYDVVIALGVY